MNGRWGEGEGAPTEIAVKLSSLITITIILSSDVKA